MKFFIVFFAILVFKGLPLQAQEIAVQRTPDSSYKDYMEHLNKTGYRSFVESYIFLSAVADIETLAVEKCLEEIYIGLSSESSCSNALRALTAKPLNSPRREMLFSLLSKMVKTRSPHASFWRNLQRGLFTTHSELEKSFPSPLNSQSPKATPSQISELETQAWKKALSRVFPLEEIVVMVNGKKVSRLQTWKPPQGVFQWALISNTHAPVIRLGEFSQFAIDSLRNLKPLVAMPCNQLTEEDVQNFGLLRIQVFSSAKCTAQFGLTPVLRNSEHLGDSKTRVQMEPSSQRHWIWPLVALAAAGAASSLQNKKITIQGPSFQ